MANHIFISYSKKDSPFVHNLADDLANRGVDVWIDRSIGGGEEWRETIIRNLKKAKGVIIVVSPNSIDSDWVNHEGSVAFGWGKKLFPILLEPVSKFPPWLEEIQYIDFFNTDYEASLAHLISAITPQNFYSKHRASIFLAIIALAMLLYSWPAMGHLVQKLRARQLGTLIEIEASKNIPLGDETLSESQFALPAGNYSIEAFAIEQFEVTNYRYELCVEAGACSPVNLKNSGQIPENYPDLPVVNVSAYQAIQFCDWIGRRLPNTYEWERAARYTDGRKWPWNGNLPPADDPDRYSYANIDYEYDGPRELSPIKLERTRLGKSEEGIFDLVGNVWEWTCTSMASSSGICVLDKQNSKPDFSLLEFAIRGGSAENPPFESIAYQQIVNDPNFSSDLFGFRCAKSK